MNGLYKDLEAVEGACFRDLHLLAEPLHLLDMTVAQIQKTTFLERYYLQHNKIETISDFNMKPFTHTG